jgi:hypothetical protein
LTVFKCSRLLITRTNLWRIYDRSSSESEEIRADKEFKDKVFMFNPLRLQPKNSILRQFFFHGIWNYWEGFICCYIIIIPHDSSNLPITYEQLVIIQLDTFFFRKRIIKCRMQNGLSMRKSHVRISTNFFSYLQLKRLFHHLVSILMSRIVVHWLVAQEKLLIGIKMLDFQI